jgi:cysteine desulfurase
MKIYLDNAATTQLDTEVFKAMTPYLLEHYGNPSSHHAHGREAKLAIENARATIARLINASPEEIIFTSGGTEADNTAILSTVRAQQIKNVITTPLEHHAVLHALENLDKQGEIKLTYLTVNKRGEIFLKELEQLLQTNARSFVSVMHANNEIGNLNDIEAIGEICERYNAIFHTDTVQTIGHYRHDLQKLKAHFIASSAHKFHGPKGVGFLYCRKGTNLTKLLHGGAQERQLRAGTENIHGIIGLAKALEIAYQDIAEHQTYIQGLKDRLITKLTEQIPGILFNGNSAIADKSLYTVLSVNLPDAAVELLPYLDEQGVSVSGGSACSTGFASHVLQALKGNISGHTIRFSFSKFNTAEEIDFAVAALAAVYRSVAA